jgi:hypothetical protein
MMKVLLDTNVILTNKKKDFKLSLLPVMSADEFKWVENLCTPTPAYV